MTTDPNDVEAWLDQFAPEVDRTATTQPNASPVVTSIHQDPLAPNPLAYDGPDHHSIDPLTSTAPQATFSAPAVAPGFPEPQAPSVAAPVVGDYPAPGELQVPAAASMSEPLASGSAANGLTADQVGSTVGVQWNADDWSEEKFAEATGGMPAINSEEDFSQGLESALPRSDRHSSHVVGFLLEWLPILIGAAIVAALVRTFVFQAFYIPSGSMMPTLKEQDRVLVNKLSYDFNDVGWGDVIVFKRPPDAPGTVPDLIKRVMALPGDTIEVFNGDVYVNNVRVEESYLLQQGVSTRLRGDPIPGCMPADATPDRCTVPEGHVFVMGDNRGGSTDSRSFGPIPVDDIVGRAVVRVWPLNNLEVF